VCDPASAATNIIKQLATCTFLGSRCCDEDDELLDTDGYRDLVCFPDSSSDKAIAATSTTSNKQESPAVADKPAQCLRKVCTVYVRAVGL